MTALTSLFEELYQTESSTDVLDLDVVNTLYDVSIESVLGEIGRTLQLLTSVDTLDQALTAGTLSNEGYEIAVSQVFQMTGLSQIVADKVASMEADDTKKDDVKKGRIRKAIDWVIAKIKELWAWLTGKKTVVEAKLNSAKAAGTELAVAVKKADADIKEKGATVNTETGTILLGPPADDAKLVEVKSMDAVVTEVVKVEKKSKERMVTVKVLKNTLLTDGTYGGVTFAGNEGKRFLDTPDFMQYWRKIVQKDPKELGNKAFMQDFRDELKGFDNDLNPSDYELVNAPVSIKHLMDLLKQDPAELEKRILQMNRLSKESSEYMELYLKKVNETGPKSEEDVNSMNRVLAASQLWTLASAHMRNYNTIADRYATHQKNLYFTALRYVKKIK